MALYKVVWTIDIDAESPKEAAEEAQELLNEGNDWQFFVQKEGEQDIYSVDFMYDTIQIVAHENLKIDYIQ